MIPATDFRKRMRVSSYYYILVLFKLLIHVKELINIILQREALLKQHLKIRFGSL